MPPPKAARGGQDDSKADTPKEKNGSGSAAQSNGKMRRVASSAGSNLREVANANAAKAAAAPAEPGAAAVAQEATTPGVSPRSPDAFSQANYDECANRPRLNQLQWPAFERDVLHAYRRAYRLKTPTAFVSDHHQWVLTQPGSIGLYSPTIARRKELRRQTNDQLSSAVRRHFNGLGVQENDVITSFLHKVRSQGASKGRTRIPRELDR